MGTIRTFKDIKAWQKSVELTEAIYHLSNRGSFSHDIALKYQIRRAVISIPSNIAEGYERDGNREFVQFLTVAKGSTAEVQTQAYIAFQTNYISQGEYDYLDSLCREIIRIISGFISYLRSSTVKGIKFKRDEP
jgi:four helix bundle protein